MSKEAGERGNRITCTRFCVSESQYTGWLKLKYPTGQNENSRQPCEIFIPTFLIYMGEILLQF